MLRSIGMVIVGIGMLFYGWGFYSKPLPSTAPERGGWLYQTFGQEGLAFGSSGMGLHWLVMTWICSI